MEDGNTVDSLEIEIEASSTDAVEKLDKLTEALKKLREETNKGFGNVREKISGMLSSDTSPAAAKTRQRRTALDRVAGASRTPVIDVSKASAQIEDLDKKIEKANTNIAELNEQIRQLGFAHDKAQGAQAIEQLNKELTAQKGILDGLIEKRNRLSAAISGQPVPVQPGTESVLEETTLQKKIDLWQRLKNIISSPTKVKLDSSDIDKAGRRANNFQKLLKSIERIAFYRTIRTMLSAITNGIKEGIQNLYQYSAIMGTEFKPAMDQISTSALYLKNSLGAMLGPAIQSLAPIIDMVVDKFVSLINVINQFFAALTGQGYTKAIKQATEYATATDGAAKSLKNFMLGIDELNVIDTSGGAGAGGAVQDFGDKFEEADIDPRIQSLADKLKELLPTIAAIGAAFAGWKITSGLLQGIDTLSKKLNGITGTKNISIAFQTVGLLGFLNDLKKFSDFFDDFQKNGPTFENVVGMLSEFVGMIGDLALIAGKTKLGGFLKIVQGVGELVVAIKDIADNGINWDNANLAIQGITDIGIGISAMTGNWKLTGVFLTVQGLGTIITEIGKNWEAIKKGDWSGVDKAALLIGALETIGGIAIALGALGNIKGLVKSGDASSAVADVANETGAINSPLKDLAKNLAWGIVIIAEVSAAAVIIFGAIQIMGRQLEDIGNAWQPVIENGPTIALAISIGAGILVGVGLAAALLGKATTGSGGTIALDIGVGTAVLLEVGAAAALFITEIWGVGEGLQKIGDAWQPVLDNGETIANGIALGTSLLVGIGVVTAALGAVTIASAGTLPVAIGIGTAVLAELAVAFVSFTESLVSVADELGDRLSPALDRLNPKLPKLNSDMSDFSDSMIGLASEISSYTGSMGSITWSSIVSGFQKLFAGNPIQSLTNDVDSIATDTSGLNEKLKLANPELELAVDMTSNYASLMKQLQSNMESSDSVNLPNQMFTNMKTVGNNLVTGLVKGIDEKRPDFSDRISSLGTEISTMIDDNLLNYTGSLSTATENTRESTSEMTTMYKNMADRSNSFIRSIISSLNSIPRNITTVHTIITENVSGGSNLGNTTKKAAKAYASGGFPETGQMFIARERGPELVGTIGQKTAVANNAQIESGIEEAAYRGFVRAMSEGGSQQNQQPIVVESKLYLDGKQITSSVEKTQKERGASIMPRALV